MQDAGIYKTGFKVDLDEIQYIEAISFGQRFLGLIGSRSKKVHSMYFNNCRSVHTFGMRKALIITFLDSNKFVLKSVVVKPNRIIFGPKGTKGVIEEVVK